MSIEDDMRDAVDARLNALVELHRRRRESASRFNEEKQERRQAGVEARHRRKLARENATPAETARGEQTPPTAESRELSPPTFRAWLLALAEKRPGRSGRFLYRLARDAARLDGWNTPAELIQAMETYESGTGHGAPPMPAAERVNAAVMLYRAHVGVDDRPVMTPVDPAEGHGNGAAG